MKKIFKYQMYHLLSYILLGIILFLLFIQYTKNNTSMFGLTAFNWAALSWISAGIFQLWILLFWRSELYFGKISKFFGKSGFTIHRFGFVTLAAVRLLPIIPISFLTKNSIQINPFIKILLIAGSIPFILWAIYSVFIYFGINRAFGADHFFKDYRTKKLEKRGIYKYISNSMYVIVSLLLYHPGLFYNSLLGLVTALIHHLFIWTHYFCTEKPDLKEIYTLNK